MHHPGQEGGSDDLPAGGKDAEGQQGASEISLWVIPRDFLPDMPAHPRLTRGAIDPPI
ncbi:hypothetical protein IBTHAUMO2_920013 [Nitrosopumilaceae archaeon]|nr:hypothetical protein IBTHAUMO2_920013 [Nitrosopumilaceae archaeon]